MRARQVQRLYCFLFCSCGWSPLAHSAPLGSEHAQLEVLGEIRIEVRIEASSGGRSRLLGTLSDEVGQPISGTLVVTGPPGTDLVLLPCASPLQQAGGPKQSILSVPPSGEICAEFVGDASELQVLAQAPHFIETKTTVQSRDPLSLPAPQFLNAPQTLDLQTTRSVDLLAGPVGKELPSDTQLTLSIICPDADPIALARKPALGLRMLRFEVTLGANAGSGNCQLVATSSAPGFSDAQSTRNVLVRTRVTIETVSTQLKDATALIEVAVRTGDRPTQTGTLQAISSGAYLTGAPVKNGRAVLEVQRGPSSLELSIAYASSLASLLPGNEVSVVVPARAMNKSWTGLHLVGLLLFGSWLTYLWLNPRTKRRAPDQRILPPRTAGITTEGKSGGPLHGTISDAHTGQGLPKVLLRIEAIGPEATEVLEETNSDEEGNFKFKTQSPTTGLLRLVAVTPTHMTLVAPIQSSRVAVHLTQRRRALVENLVQWAKSRGSPWFTGSAPTPGGVEKAARQKKQPLTESWAAAVASAAYSPNSVSEEEVQQLRTPQTNDSRAESPLKNAPEDGLQNAQLLDSKPETSR